VGAWGQAEQTLYGNGVTNRSAFEAATGRVTALSAGLAASPSLVMSQHYSWDSLSHLMSRIDDNGEGTSGLPTSGAVSESFTYGDALSRLTNYSVSAPGILPSYGRSVGLTYNALGMLQYKSDVGTYSYPAQGGVAGSQPHALKSVNGSYIASYGYDLNGNVTSATAGKYRSVSYTSFNQPDNGQGLQGPTSGTSGSPQYTWQYDENHAQVRETRLDASGTRTTWTMGSSFESETAPSGSISNRHMLSVGGQVIGVLVSTDPLPAPTVDITQSPPANIKLVKVEYWHKDHLGSLISTTDHTGAVTARYAYDPFGKRRYTNGNYDAAGNVVADWSSTSNAGTKNGFSGEEQLDDVGVVHMNGQRSGHADRFTREPTGDEELSIAPDCSECANVVRNSLSWSVALAVLSAVPVEVVLELVGAEVGCRRFITLVKAASRWVIPRLRRGTATLVLDMGVLDAGVVGADVLAAGAAAVLV
jgi:hypothetical protein